MRRTTLFATALMTLSLVPAVQAQHRGYPDRDHRDHDRHGYDHGRSGRVTELARAIEETATSIHRQAERNNRRPNRAEARVLSDLHTLEERAEQFRYQVGDYHRGNDHRRGSGRTSRSFAALEGAFFETAESLRYIKPRPYIDRGMDRIYSLMSEVSRYYGRGYRNGYDRWDRNRGWSRQQDRYGRDEHRYGRERYRDYYKDGDHDDDDRHRH